VTAGTSSATEPEYLESATDASSTVPREVTESVREIIDTVRDRGDDGVRDLTRRFDGVERERLRVDGAEIEAAAEALTDPERRAIDNTIANVRAFHEEQADGLDGFEREFDDGVSLGTRIVPIERAGVYVPGGRKPLVAAPTMRIVPATVAGVDRVIACAPP